MLKNKQTNKKPNTSYPNFADYWSFSFWRERCPLVWWVHLPLQSSERYCPTWGKGFTNNLPEIFFFSERGPLITDFVISSVLTSQEIMPFFLPFVKIFFCHHVLTPNFSHPSELTSVKKILIVFSALSVVHRTLSCCCFCKWVAVSCPPHLITSLETCILSFLRVFTTILTNLLLPWCYNVGECWSDLSLSVPVTVRVKQVVSS